MSSSPALQIFTSLLSAAAVLIGGLVLYNLKSLKCYIDKLDRRMGELEAEQKRLAERKQECQRDFVSSESWIRSESFTRSKLDSIAEAVGKLAGSLKVVEQMPQICGQIARDIIREMKGG